MLTGYKIIHVPAQAAYSYKRRFTVKGKPEKAPKVPKASKLSKNVTVRKKKAAPSKKFKSPFNSDYNKL